MGRVTASMQTTNYATYGFSYTYNVAGALATETYPSGFVATNLYDAAGRATQVSGNNGVNYVSNVAYDPALERMGVKLPPLPSYNDCHRPK